jgi:hypothetical protein
LRTGCHSSNRVISRTRHLRRSSGRDNFSPPTVDDVVTSKAFKRLWLQMENEAGGRRSDIAARTATRRRYQSDSTQRAVVQVNQCPLYWHLSSIYRIGEIQRSWSVVYIQKDRRCLWMPRIFMLYTKAPRLMLLYTPTLTISPAPPVPIRYENNL